jgi:ferredoxin
VKIVFDEAACTGHGRCYALAPDVFDADDQGHCVVKVVEVTGELEANARLAAANCPEAALSVED